MLPKVILKIIYDYHDQLELFHSHSSRHRENLEQIVQLRIRFIIESVNFNDNFLLTEILAAEGRKSFSTEAWYLYHLPFMRRLAQRCSACWDSPTTYCHHYGFHMYDFVDDWELAKQFAFQMKLPHLTNIIRSFMGYSVRLSRRDNTMVKMAVELFQYKTALQRTRN